MQVTSVVRASESSFQVKWTESHFERGSLASTSRWTAILTVQLRPPRSADMLRKNPLGLYVDAVDWSRELDTPAPAPAPAAPAPSTPEAPAFAPAPAQPGAAVPQGSPLDPAPAARAGQPAQSFREDCPMTRTIPASLLPAGADRRRAAGVRDSVAPCAARGGADRARPVGQPRGSARAVARRLCQCGPDLSLFRRDALPALRGARAGDRHRASARRGGHRGRGRRHRALDGRRHDERQRRDAAHAHPGQALLGGPQDQPRHHHRPARLSYPAREHPRDGDGGLVLDLSAGRADRLAARFGRRGGGRAGRGRPGGRESAVRLSRSAATIRPGGRCARSTTGARPSSSFRRRSRRARRRLCSCSASAGEAELVNYRMSGPLLCRRPAVRRGPSCGSAPSGRRSSGSAATMPGGAASAGGGRHERRTRDDRAGRRRQGRSGNPRPARQARRGSSASGAA